MSYSTTWAEDKGGVYVKVEGIHCPVTSLNTTNSEESDSSLASIPQGPLAGMFRIIILLESVPIRVVCLNKWHS